MGHLTFLLSLKFNLWPKISQKVKSLFVWTQQSALTCSRLWHFTNNNNNNNNKHDNVYGAVIMEEPLREFTRFIWWMWNGAKRPPTQDKARRLRLWVRLYSQKLHPPPPFIITQPESWYSFYRPTQVEGWVDLAGWLHTEMVYPSTDGHPSEY